MIRIIIKIIKKNKILLIIYYFFLIYCYYNREDKKMKKLIRSVAKVQTRRRFKLYFDKSSQPPIKKQPSIPHIKLKTMKGKSNDKRINEKNNIKKLNIMFCCPRKDLNLQPQV